MNEASRFRLRHGSQPSGMGVTAGSLSGYMPASGGFTGDGVIASGLVEPEALQGTAQSQLSSLAGLDGPTQFTPFVPPMDAEPAPAPAAPAAPVAAPDMMSGSVESGDSGYGGLADANGFNDPVSQQAVADMNNAISAGFGPESSGFGAPGSSESGDSGYGGIGDAGWGGMDGGYGNNAADGWMDGGYTGHGHPAQPAGTVHKGEVVIPAEMVARYGLRPLMALVEGQVQPSRLAALARG